MTKIKKQFTVVICSIIMLLGGFFSFGKTQAKADDAMDQMIENIIPGFVEDVLDYHSGHGWLYIFVDPQLMQYSSFLDSFFDYFGLSSAMDEEMRFAELFNFGIVLLVYDSGYSCYSLTETAYNRVNNYYEEAIYYDFSEPGFFEYFFETVASSTSPLIDVCGMGIWALNNDCYQFLYEAQSVGFVSWPVYVIRRDPITVGADGLYILVKNENSSGFYVPEY